MGAMFLEKVTSVAAAGAACWALETTGMKRSAATRRASLRVCLDVIAHYLQAKSYTQSVVVRTFRSARSARRETSATAFGMTPDVPTLALALDIIYYEIVDLTSA